MNEMLITNKRGLGLLEVLAAIALLALGVTSIFGVFGNATAWNQEAGQRTQAVSFASAIIEGFKAQPSGIRPMPETAIAELNLELEPPPGVEAAVSIREYDEYLDLYLVVVKVGWPVRGELKWESLTALMRGCG